MGLKAVGKTYCSDFLKLRYNATILYLTRMLEKKVQYLEAKNEIYYELAIKNKSRIPLMNYLNDEIKKSIENSNFIVIEGVVSENDCNWCCKTLGINCIKVYIESIDKKLRFQKYIRRHNYSKEYAKRKLKKSDKIRKIRERSAKKHADFIIKNHFSPVDFETAIERMVIKILSKQIKVSILVPIYNSQKFLRRCINSITFQTYENIEIILVDDGSDDDSLKICREYSSIDSRIIIISKWHRGLVATRKTAVSNATGDYVLCVDSDDYIESDTVECMLKSAIKNDADVVCTGYIKEKGFCSFPRRNVIDSGVYAGDRLKCFFSKMIYAGNFYQPGIMPFICNKLIKRELYTRFQMTVPLEISRGEDVAVIYPMLANSSCIVIDNEFKPYHYIKNSSSICQTLDLEHFEKMKILFTYLDSLLKDEIFIKQLAYYKVFALKCGIEKYISDSFDSPENKSNYLKNKMNPFSIDEIIAQTDLLKDMYINDMILAMLSGNFSRII